MEISRTASSASHVGGVNGGGEQTAAATRKSAEQRSQPPESTRVQLSASGQAKSASAPTETEARRLQDNKNGEAAAKQSPDRRVSPPQQGFSFNGVAAYSRVFSS